MNIIRHIWARSLQKSLTTM